MSILANLFLCLACHKVNVIFFDSFEQLFVWLVASQWKVSNSFCRTVETIKTWWQLTNFGGNNF
jgi:hypothetical protein